MQEVLERDINLAPIVESVRLSNQVQLHYVAQGDPAGTPVVLLHGYTDSWRSYERVLPYLPPTMRAFALTQRGHGDSDRPLTGYDARDFATDVAQWMDSLGAPQAVIVGHSMGSTIARRFALDYPERCLGLVLVGSFLNFRGNPLVEALVNEVLTLVTDPVDPGYVRAFQESTLAQPVPPAYLATVIEESLKAPARVWRAVAEDLLTVDFAEELGRIQTPTLIVWGAQDTFCPRADQDGLVEAIADAQLVVYARAGHAVHWEEPERFAADLTDFVQRLAR